MNFLNPEIPKGASHTHREIIQQPALWQQVLDSFNHQSRSKITEGRRIIITGAGSSSFVGLCTAPYWSRKASFQIEAISTTDLVAVPYLHFRDEPTLLVSIARSGDSPESMAAVKLAEQLITDIKHIFITCNPEGGLARYSDKSNIELILMPEEANDQGFAMTSSFTTMVLTVLLLSDGSEQMIKSLRGISRNGQKLLSDCPSQVAQVLTTDFDRIVFLGDGDLTALAREAALKMLELSSGKVVPVYDSLLGFRHGPKAIINNQTIIVVFLSNNLYTRQYQIDLINEIAQDNEAAAIVVLSSEQVELPAGVINYSTDDHDVPEDIYLIFNYLLYAQLLTLHKSIQLQIDTDNPMPSGTINRVVKGVTVYEYCQ